MGEELNRYEKDLNIDRDHLDNSWIDQPILYMTYAELQADAEKRVNDLKEEMDVLRSGIDLKIRNGSYGPAEGLKVTEGTISALINQDADIGAKTKEINKAKYELSMIKGAVEAFQHRKKALEKLSDLFIFGYNSEPKAGRADAIRDLKNQRHDGVDGNED